MLELLRSNQVLSSAIEQSERRCTQLEERAAKKAKYESLVKRCQRLQCKQCNHLYTPALFTQHVQHCGGSRASNLSANSSQMVMSSGIVPASSQASPSPQQQVIEDETPHSNDSENPI
jgi:hypothetical protein